VNDLDGALAHLQKGSDLLPFWGKADDAALAYLTWRGSTWPARR